MHHICCIPFLDTGSPLYNEKHQPQRGRPAHRTLRYHAICYSASKGVIVDGQNRVDVWRANPLLRGGILLLLLAMLLFAAAPARAQTGTTTHVVAWGETLSQIALRYGVSVEAIIQANDLEGPDRIYAGQTLIIPGGQAGAAAHSGSSGGTHTVQAGENLFRIGLRYGVSVEELMAANGIGDPSQVYAGQTLTIPAPGSVNTSAAPAPAASSPPAAARTHTVQPGQTLFSISRQYNVSVQDLVNANNLLNPSAIYAGQTLTIPGAASSGSTPGYTPAQSATTYTVQPGDTLASIAARYGVPLWSIVQANNLSNPSLLHAGNVLTIPSAGALSQAAPQPAAPGASKHIVVDISDQRAYIYENGALKWTFVVSTGMPGTPTARGNFQIQNKIPMAYASTWDLDMPWWLGIYWAGPLQNGFHALPIMSNGVRLWESVLGQPASYGCIILSDADAKTLYDWADIGTPVTIRD